MKTKTLNNCRKEMMTGQPFSITFCTFDEKRKTGGERHSYDGVVMVYNEQTKKAYAPVAIPAAVKDNSVKHPEHWTHNTFNVRTKSGDVRKIHWLLIEQFNNFKVVM